MFSRFTQKGFLKAIRHQDIGKINEYLSHKDAEKFLTTSRYNYTPLMYTIHWGSFEAFKTLLQSEKVDIRKQEKNGKYPFNRVIYNGNTSFFKESIQYFDAQDLNNGCYLHTAVTNNEFQMFKILLEHGADINHQGYKNNTPLHLALQNSQHGFIEYILQQPETRTDQRNDDGLTQDHLIKLQDKSLVKNTSTTNNENNHWEMLNETTIAHIQTFQKINRKITEVFNFESEERFIISENLNTNAESTSPIEGFKSISQKALKKAFDVYVKNTKGHIPANVDTPVMIKSKPQQQKATQ